MKTKIGILALGCLILSTAAAPDKEGKVRGGVNAAGTQNPYLVAILRNRGLHCGGSIIAKRLVLTAAHCVSGYNKNDFDVVAGSTDLRKRDGEWRKVTDARWHENYNEDTTDNDIALIWLDEDLPFNDLIRAINIPNEHVPVNTGAAELSGYGSTGPGESGTPVRQRVTITINSEDLCKQDPTFTSNMICAANDEYKNSCSGDSGGPLVQNDYLIGIVSWGYSTKGGVCDTLAPSFFVRVRNYGGWIVNQIQKKMDEDEKKARPDVIPETNFPDQSPAWEPRPPLPQRPSFPQRPPFPQRPAFPGFPDFPQFPDNTGFPQFPNHPGFPNHPQFPPFGQFQGFPEDFNQN